MLNFHQTCIKLNKCHFNSLLSINLVTAYQNTLTTFYKTLHYFSTSLYHRKLTIVES